MGTKTAITEIWLNTGDFSSVRLPTQRCDVPSQMSETDFILLTHRMWNIMPLNGNEIGEDRGDG
jgi:hypothetical protein